MSELSHFGKKPKNERKEGMLMNLITIATVLTIIGGLGTLIWLVWLGVVLMNMAEQDAPGTSMADCLRKIYAQALADVEETNRCLLNSTAAGKKKASRSVPRRKRLEPGENSDA
jgi:hypothetical protein